MTMTPLEQGLKPFEKKLRRQERFRKLLGVREVERPTYERYITGKIERFHSQKNAFAAMKPENPFEEHQAFRADYIRKTGAEWFSKPLPQSELDMEHRPGQALGQAGWRICTDYHPDPRPITPPEGRYEASSPARMSRLIKKVAMYFGAEMVRITRIDQRWVYADREISHPYAIVCVVPHYRPFNDTAPSHLSGAGVAETYSRLKYITTQLTDFIRLLGYDAMYRETLGWEPDMLMVPLAIDAGIGEYSRNARCISPEFGNNMRLKAVTTDLPLVPDKPISFGVHDFCTECKNCAIYCPANAVAKDGPTEALDLRFNNPGFKKWYVRADRCLQFWMASRKEWITCGGRCISVCPWNKPMTLDHNIVRWLAIHSPNPVKRLLAAADRIVYHRKKSIK